MSVSKRGLRFVHRPPTEDGSADGRLLLLVHGAMDRASSFMRVMSKLPDWEILAYDRRGYGQSLATGPPADFQDQVDDLLDVLAELGCPGERPAVAFGHSFGADVVLASLAQHPGVLQAEFVWEPPQPWLPYWPREPASQAEATAEDRAEWFMRRMIGDSIWERLPSATRAHRRAEGPTLVAEVETISERPVFDPDLIHAPVLVGRGGRSMSQHRRSARELAASLPHGTLVEIPESAHGAHLSHPRDVAAFIRRVAGIPAAERSAPY